MSMYQLLGIDHESKLQTLTSSNLKEDVLAYALSAAPRFRQLFLLKEGHNVKELRLLTTIEESEYAPQVRLR